MNDYEKAVVTSTQKSTPAVVSVYISGTQYFRFANPVYDMMYGVQRKDISAMGSGVIIDPKGTIITNDHVVDDVNGSSGAKIQVVLSDGRNFQAKVVKELPKQDIAILKIDAKDLPYIEMGNSSELVPGQTVIVIGNPFGTSISDGLKGGEPTVTKGIISATKRNLRIPMDNGEIKYYRNMLQTDASINEGNSGGALIDLNGKLVGINTAILSEGSGSIGINFAIPADRVKLILESIKKYGDVTDVVSGIKVIPLNEKIVKSLNFKGQGGVIISDVESGSPGDRGGFRKGDIITGINGFTVVNEQQSRSMFKGAVPGEVYDVKIFRDGNYTDLNLKLDPK